MSANPIDLDRAVVARIWRRDRAGPGDGAPTTRHSYYQWARQRRLARRLLGRYVSAPELPTSQTFALSKAV